jgi:hydroxymethylglutaryl-CoA lyase
MPARYPKAGLPAAVRICEVGPRDGLQNEAVVLPTAVKAEFIARLAGAGLPVVEATSFVPASWVPQLADADELFAAVLASADPTVRYPVLVPNLAGLDRALAAGAGDVAVFASATETFSQRNLNRGRRAAMDMIATVVRRAKDQQLGVRGYLSMCFGDPWEGQVPIGQVVDAGVELLDCGCDELSLGDTIGVGTAGQVQALLAGFVDAGVDPARIAVHFHDTYGQALANTLTALSVGVSTVDASAGGLGGCPFAGSATGNLATEDLVWMLTGLGVDTGVDLSALVATSSWMAGQLGRPSPSRVVTALAGPPATGA